MIASGTSTIGFVGTGVMGGPMAGHALDSAAELGIDLPGAELASHLYESLMATGHGDEGTQALYWLYQD